MKRKKLWNYGKRLCSMVIVIAILVNLMPMEILAVENADAGLELSDVSNEVADAEVTTTEEVHVLGEVTENRTKFSKEFQLSNGLHMTSIYAAAVHYEEDGAWKEIDNTLRLENKASGNAYATTAGRWKVSFPQNMTAERGVTITKDGYELSFYLDGELYDAGQKTAVKEQTEERESEESDGDDISGDIEEVEMNSDAAESTEAMVEETSEMESLDAEMPNVRLQENEMQIAEKIYRMKPVKNSTAAVEQIDMTEL